MNANYIEREKMILKYKDLTEGDLVKVENALTYDGSRIIGEGRIVGFGTVAYDIVEVWVDVGEERYKSFKYEDIKKVAPQGDVSHVAS